MVEEPWVSRSFEGPYIQFRCACGWTGPDVEQTEWVIEERRDRAVRRCPACGDPVPEWGTLGPIDGLAPIAEGSLATALADAGAVEFAEAPRGGDT